MLTSFPDSLYIQYILPHSNESIVIILGTVFLNDSSRSIPHLSGPPFAESVLKSIINTLKYCKGLKYFLTDFSSSQGEIENFIIKCKKHEDNDGFLKPTFFEINKNLIFEFTSGPFTNLVFKVLYENKLSINALIGNYKITVSKDQNFFRPV